VIGAEEARTVEAAHSAINAVTAVRRSIECIRRQPE
jgi:hypothetical protein